MQGTFLSWLWQVGLVCFLHFIIWHVFSKDLIQVALDKFKPVCGLQRGLGQTLTAVALNLNMLKAVCPCLILLRKNPDP